MKNTETKELDMVQLGSVNGGTIGQISGDSELLHKLGLMDEDFGTFEVLFDWEDCADEVEKAWEKVGVKCICYPDFDNTYSYQGHPISWNEAQRIAKDKMIKGPQIGPRAY